MPRSVRVAAVQYAQQRVEGFAVFAGRVAQWVAVAADYGSDFVLFPELLTLQLLSAEPEVLAGEQAIDRLVAHTASYESLLGELARQHDIHIIGGTHLCRNGDGEIRNSCPIALRDGTILRREKLHPTPSEREFWGVGGGGEADVIDTDAGPVGVMICYDAEFPELARHLVDQGARILFVPYCTDVRPGHLRVRYCCQARAVEDQVYVVAAGNVGNIPGVGNFDIQYAQSGIFTPCDFAFAAEGIAAQADAGVEQLIFADLDLEALDGARQRGTVQNLNDRRTDLYQTTWNRRG